MGTSKKKKSSSVVKKTEEQQQLAVKAAKSALKLSEKRHKENLEEAVKHVSVQQVEKAVSALLKHVKAYKERVKQNKKTLDLLEDDPEDELVEDSSSSSKDFVHISLAIKKCPAKMKLTFKLYKVFVSHPMYSLKSDIDICLIVKDKEEAKKWLEQQPVPGIKKVVALSKLRSSYSSFKHKRELWATYDMFLADDRIITMLPKTLGRVFYSSHKRPIPIRLAQNASVTGELHNRVDVAVKSAYFHFAGTCSTMRVARVTAPENHIVDNVMDAIADAVQRVPKGWDNIQAVFVKTGNSAALPVFKSLPDEDVDVVVEEEEETEGEAKEADEGKNMKKRKQKEFDAKEVTKKTTKKKKKEKKKSKK